jgi:hypothetical protein
MGPDEHVGRIGAEEDHLDVRRERLRGSIADAHGIGARRGERALRGESARHGVPAVDSGALQATRHGALDADGDPLAGDTRAVGLAQPLQLDVAHGREPRAGRNGLGRQAQKAARAPRTSA